MPVQLPTPSQRPLRAIGVRVVVALALLLLVAIVAYLGRDGYRERSWSGPMVG